MPRLNQGDQRPASKRFTKSPHSRRLRTGKQSKNNNLHDWHVKCCREASSRKAGQGGFSGHQYSTSRTEVEAMHAKMGASIKTWLLAAGAMLAMLALAPQANATVVRIHLSGAVGSGYADLTLGPARADDVIDPSHLPLAITDASGTFGGVAITGVRGIDHTTAPGEVLPYSYSLFSIPGYGDHDGVSYDNLFYAGGSPLICLVDGTLVYPFAGGFLDLMGVMFTLDNGNFLDLWSFGDTAPGFFGPNWPGGLTYGMKLVQPNAEGGYDVLDAPPFARASVPEPDLLWLFGAVVLGLFAWRRMVEARRLKR